jgi:hypothetical protein
MAQLDVIPLDSDLVLVAADPEGDWFHNSGRERLVVRSEASEPATVTLLARRPLECPEALLHDETWEIAPGAQLEVEPARIPRNRFNDSQGRATVTYSDATDLLVGVKRVLP